MKSAPWFSALIVLSTATVATAGLVGISATGQLSEISIPSGGTARIQTFNPRLNEIWAGIAATGSGNYIGLSNVLGSMSLRRLNTETGQHTLLSSISPAPSFDIVIRPGTEGLIYSCGGIPGQLWRAEISPSGLSLINRVSIPLSITYTFSSMTFDPRDLQLYAWVPNRGLIRVDRDTGQIEHVDPTFSQTGNVISMAFGPGGVLYGSRDNGEFVTLDVLSGAVTQIGSFGAPQTGLVWVPAPGAGLFVAGAALIATRRRNPTASSRHI